MGSAGNRRMMFTTLLIQAGLIALAQGHYLESSSQESRVQYLNTSTVSLRVGSNQNLRCFDQVNESGYYVNFGTTAVPDLSRSPYNFDNRAVSCRFNGIYFLYDNYNYNPNGNAAVYAETWGDNYNANLNDFAYKATSVRLTGAPDGYKYDTFNTYQYEYYQGSEQYFYQDATYTKVDNFGKSIVVTGCNPWTVYDYTNYGGFSVCFYPADPRNCSPGFFRDAQVMGGMQNRISSARKGCFSNIKLVGEPLENLRGNLKPSVGHDGKVFTPGLD